ncbi:Phosphoadenosine phosphosulfate reductase [Planktothrix tepida]|uniref:Phosphoadenosine 5'-phosphosulfate reductase n=1 Tax=Planktothrix tepida PCC 9214 TaxID=671072 RepID=A0A1J1LD99_9CYAN|nr:phosphoadenosine phosphosulfate reductase [Planktothrix tepida]CAD5914978.1 Phosphoadenosine phosphosulfate reductase [Planktothrix tepida]CUR30583.1 Phosphoadenosine phosphosulfate reductase [Planktothrix tepida PCC 9214]
MPQLNLIDPNGNGNLSSISSSVANGHTPSQQQRDHRDQSSDHKAVQVIQPLELDLDAVNQQLADADALTIVKWAAEVFGDGLVMSTSFGIQAAVMLHLVTRIVPNIPIIWVDTGYLPTETYIFAEELTQRLNLNLKVYQSPISPARMEALHGRLWEKNDVEALNYYDKIRKVEPMQQALKELKAMAWLAGLRADQTSHRRTLNRVAQQSGYYKVHPILSWNSRDIYQYLTTYNLPYHPYFDLGYTTVGDWHSSRPLMATDENERDTRFRGLKQECGLHLPQTEEEAKSLDSSSL